MEQLYVIKKSMYDFCSENITSNSLELIENLKKKYAILWTKIQQKLNHKILNWETSYRLC